MRACTILLIRHGEIENPKQIIYGRNIDLPLSDKGRKQILRLAKTIKRMNFKPYKIFSSPLTRAIHSAEILKDFFNIPRYQLRVDKRLLDSNIPVFAGKPIVILEDLNRKGVDEYDDRFVKRGNESKKDIMDRMYQVFKKVVNESLGKTVIIVSHGDPIKLLMFKLTRHVLKDIPLAGSKEFRETDYLNKGAAWAIAIDKDIRVLDNVLIR